jgi:kumamolisin
MPHESLVPLPGSARTAVPDAGPADPATRLELTLVLRRTAPGVAGAATTDVALVRSVLGSVPGVTVTSVHAPSRRVKVAGTLGDLSAAFGTTVRMAQAGHRYRTGTLYLPAALDGVVTAVLGLDNRPTARAHFRARTASATEGPTFTPNQVASSYGFPAGTDGTGQIIALVELGGGFETSDLTTYFGGLGIAVPSVTAVSVDGVANEPGSDPTGADVEVALDIEVAGAAAPGATQLVYFAPNSDQGFVDSVSDAAHASPAPVVISISWGQSEDSWTAQGRTALDDAIADACALGITVCVAAGDNGSSDGVSDGQPHVDFPASSPHALACGGTTLVVSATGAITSETVWNDGSGGGAGGGGVSDTFAVPTWQATAGVPARASGGTGASPTSPATGVTPVAGASSDPESLIGDIKDGVKEGVKALKESVRRHSGSGSGSGSKAGGSGAGGSGTGSSGAGGSDAGAGRGVPDVAGNADPETGYQVMADGKMQVVGGTSAVAPLWAALIARLAQATGTRFGLIQTPLYAGVMPGATVAGFNDIVSGSNGAYSAGPGWDACTGLGSPDGPALLERLAP